MKTRSLVQRRMYAQMLWGNRAGTIEEVISRLGALQAQEFPVARWSIGQRCKSPRRTAVDEALAEGRILRTHVLRPTWHVVLPEDIRWMLRLTGPRVKAKLAHYDRRLELDERLYSRTNELIAKAVGQGHRTRAELAAVLERKKIPAKGQRLGHIVLRAELDAVICSGAPRGKQQTYASLDERASKSASKAPDDPVVELARRYFISHGPATVKDFAWWSGLTQGMARDALDTLDSGLASESIDGRIYWFDPAVASVRERSDTVDLVQLYDEIGIAYSQSRDLLLGTRSRPSTDGTAAALHTILLDGLYAGTWRTSAGSDWTEVQTFPHVRMTRSQKSAVNEAAERYRQFTNDRSVKESSRAGV